MDFLSGLRQTQTSVEWKDGEFGDFSLHIAGGVPKDIVAPLVPSRPSAVGLEKIGPSARHPEENKAEGIFLAGDISEIDEAAHAQFLEETDTSFKEKEQ